MWLPGAPVRGCLRPLLARGPCTPTQAVLLQVAAFSVGVVECATRPGGALNLLQHLAMCSLFWLINPVRGADPLGQMQHQGCRGARQAPAGKWGWDEAHCSP